MGQGLDVFRQGGDGLVRWRSRLGLPGANVGAHGLERVGSGFAVSSSENIYRGHQLNFNESSLLDGVQVLSFQESSADSRGPQVHFALGVNWYLFVGHNVRLEKP